jgi:hypothetical protein
MMHLCKGQWAMVVLLITGIAFAVTPRASWAQLANCTLSGTVYDASGAVVPHARVIVKDSTTNSQRQVESNAAGFFSFPALLPGTYQVTVAAKGFKTWEQTGIVLSNAETRTLPNIQLAVGIASETVTVETGVEAIAPVSTGASGTTLNNEMVSQLAIVGRDAAEFIRLMPGMAMNSGLNQSQWNSQVTQSNNGPIGAFSASGTAPNGGMQMVMNGSVIVDAGNQGTQIANVNQDQTDEVQIQNSAFDAEYAHGPVVFSATGKRGASQFHGDAYVYARNGSLNSEDSFLKANKIKKPIDHYWYPGFTFGGPVVLPFTNFNRNRDRAFFFVGYEYMKQDPVGTLHQYVAPTSAMLNGDFSQVGTLFSGQWPANDVPSGTCMGKTNGLSNGTSYNITNGIIPSQCIDPSGQAYLKLMTQAPGVQYLTSRPAGASTFYNAQFLDSAPVNRYDLNLRGDVNVIKDRMTVWASYTRQPETDLNNISPWWWPGGSLPYPTGMPAQQLSKAYSIGATNTFSASLTNEATFGYAYFINPIGLSNPSAVDPAKVGYSVATPYQPLQPQIPNIVSWCCSGAGGNVPSTANAAGFFGPAFGTNWYSNGDFGKDSYTPSFSDNVTKVIRTHTLKFGFFWASYANVQTEGFGSGPNGQWEFDPWCNGSTGNIFADILTGQGACNFTQTNTIPIDNVRYHETAFFAQDQWKMTRRLTLNFGMRFTHEGQWFPSGKNGAAGLAVWNQSSYDANAIGLTGFQWHATSSGLPVSGFGSRALYYDPHVGVAYDLFGNGRTVLRGGFGIYRFQVAYNDVTENNILDGPLGVVTYTSNCKFTAFNDLTANSACVAPGSSSLTTTPSGRAGVTQGGILLGDDKVPYTQNWAIIVDQRAPWHSLLEVEYQGNRSRNLLITANGAGGIGLAGINYIAPGALFKPDPQTGITYYCQGTPSATCVPGQPDSSVIPHYRPFDYSQVDVFRHGSYSNYNALMVMWQKQTGRSVFNLNYTFSKAMGIRDGNNDNGQGSGASLDAFTLPNNYGPLAFNRTHVFNAAYVLSLPSPIHNNAFLEQAINGWQLSGVTQFQSGPPLQPLTGGALNVGYGNMTINGTTVPVSSQSILGTDGIKLVPYLVCDPTKGLLQGQYFNPSCFAAPTTRGVNGPLIWPNITGPGFFTSDLGLYKNFKVHEKQTIQFRLTAFNFMNHANAQFGLTNDINLSFSDSNNNVTQFNQNKVTSGFPGFTTGRRVLELALKYNF